MKDSNKTEVLAILEGFSSIFFLNFLGTLIVEDLMNVISWFKSNKGSWKMHFLFNEKYLSVFYARCHFIKLVGLLMARQMH